jgi:hypothetical protein
MKMAGLFDAYFAKPGSGILGGLYDDPSAAWPGAQPQPAPVRFNDLWSAVPFMNGAAKPGTAPRLVTPIGFGPPGSPFAPVVDPTFAPGPGVPQRGVQNSSGAAAADIPISRSQPVPAANALPVPSAAEIPSPPAPTDYADPAADPSVDEMGGKVATDDTSGGAFLSRLGQALHDNSSMLMAMGGGMMTGGLGKGFQAGANAANSKQQAASASRNAIMQALRQRGVPSALAQAAAENPTLLRAIVARAGWQG